MRPSIEKSLEIRSVFAGRNLGWGAQAPPALGARPSWALFAAGETPALPAGVGKPLLAVTDGSGVSLLPERRQGLGCALGLAPQHHQVGAVEQVLGAAVDHCLYALRPGDRAGGGDAALFAQRLDAGVRLAQARVVVLAGNAQALGEVLMPDED